MTDLYKKNDGLKTNVQVRDFIDEGNPNTQDEPAPAVGKLVSTISNDQQSARVTKQAMHDDHL